MLEIFYCDVTALAEEARFAKGLSLVDGRRRQKVLRIKRKEEQLRSLGAGLLLRYAMQSLGYSYEACMLQVHTNAHGKEMLNDDLFFNLSHSGPFAAVVLADQPVGVDVECFAERFAGMRGEERLRAVAGRITSAREKDYLRSLTAEEGRNAFARMWTRKESYAKEAGLGLGMELSDIDTLSDLHFLSFVLDGDAVLSVSAEQIGTSLQKPVCVQAEDMLQLF